MYADGTGVQKDETKAFEWMQKAAVQGQALAQNNLGGMYHLGTGVPKDDAKAAEWWQKAAVQGEAHAQFRLGMMYLDGKGIPQDDVRAYAWFNLAVAQGDSDAAKWRAEAEGRMTAEQKAQAQKLATELFEKMPKK